MGYELHIVRKNNWDDDKEESNISIDEWLQYIERDEELELTHERNNAFTQSDRPGFFEWINHPEADKGQIPWFDYWRGGISTKYPDDDTIKKMLRIASILYAKVQGDDGEFYDDSYFDRRDAELEELTKQKVLFDKKPWWKFW